MLCMPAGARYRHATAGPPFTIGRNVPLPLSPLTVSLNPLRFSVPVNAVAVPKGQQSEFLARLSRGLDAIRADGTWAEISKRWIGQ